MIGLRIRDVTSVIASQILADLGLMSTDIRRAPRSPGYTVCAALRPRRTARIGRIDRIPMRYATGLDAAGEDSGLCADITAWDVLSDLIGKSLRNHNDVIASALKDEIKIPEHLNDMNVIGSLITQNEDGTRVDSEVTYVIDDYTGTDDADAILLKILELDTCGTGDACRVIAVLEAPDRFRVSYARMDPDGVLSDL